METFVPAIAMIALILKLIDFARYARNGDLNGIVTQVATWVAGVVVFVLVAQTVWAQEIVIGDRPLSQLGFWSLVFAGVSIASTASVVKDTLKSVDNHNSSKIPTLLPTGPAGDHSQPPSKDVG